MKTELDNSTSLRVNPAEPEEQTTRINRYICGKKYFVMMLHTDEITNCQEYFDLVITALKDTLKYEVSVISTGYLSVTFTENIYVGDLTDSLKTALRGKFKGGRLTKTTIRNLCITFPNKNYFLIDINNGWEI